MRLEEFVKYVDDTHAKDPAATYLRYQASVQAVGGLVTELLGIRAWLDGLADALFQPPNDEPRRQMGFRPSSV